MEVMAESKEADVPIPSPGRTVILKLLVSSNSKQAKA
jgi:hypothetical protein